MDVDPQVVGLAIRVTEAMGRNSASSIADRIRTVKARKRDVETIAELEEIINDLIPDQSELIQVAQAQSSRPLPDSRFSDGH